MPNRRSRSFSPYTYNIQYAKPGAGPAQRASSYVKTAIVPEECYVVSKKAPEWYAYVSNDIYYELSDKGGLVIDYISTEFTIVNKKVKHSDYLETDLQQLANTNSNTIFDLKSSRLNSCWQSNNIVNLANHLNLMIDCVVMADGKYIKVKKQFTNESIILQFPSSFNRNAYSKVDAIVYSIDYDTDYHKIDVPLEEIEYDQVNDKLLVPNKFSSTKLMPMILDENGFTFDNAKVDITPDRVIIDGDDDMYISQVNLQNKINEAINESNQILNAAREVDASIPSSILYQENNAYRDAVDRQMNLQNQMNHIQDSPIAGIIVFASKISLYSYQRPSFTTVLRYGIDVDGRNPIKWNENSVTINHNLASDVNVMIDGSDFNIEYEIYKTSNNAIKVVFTKPKYPVCTIRIFKIGA